jgi:hypothetical protein
VSSSKAPITAVSPETDTEVPNRSPPSPSEARSCCCWLQVVPERTKTYADPASGPPAVSSLYAPTTAVSPETETETPKKSLAAPSEARSCCCWLHVDPERTKT